LRYALISQIPRLSIVLIVSVPAPRLLHASGVPHVHFQPYTRDESVRALSLDPPPIFLRPVDASYDYGDEEHMEDRRWLWQRYCEVVWDSIGKGAARDLVTFRSVCYKLWRPFVQPIVDDQIGTRDFSRLVVSKRTLFQNEDILSGVQLDGPKIQTSSGTGVGGMHFILVRLELTVKANELPYFSKFLLCGAYLASYNPARLDATYFMKATERKRRKRGGAAGKPSKHRKVRLANSIIPILIGQIPRRLLKPAPFPLDRLLAIVHSLVPQPMQQTNLIYAQIATLTSLRLLQRTGSTNADPLDPGSKLRVNCSWEFVASLGRSVGLEMRDYLAG
jgi:origin recognition complex subunit 5